MTGLVTPEMLVSHAKRFHEELKRVPNDRYLSWEHCYEVFARERKQASPDVDKLCLHLAFYLASWGMYRGSSFLLQRDYLIHRGAIKLLMDKKYDALWGIEAKEICDPKNAECALDLASQLAEYYETVREGVCRTSKKGSVKADISHTLITKILMGTMGCCPAFDRYFVRGLKELGMCQTFSMNSLVAIAKFYVANEKVFAKAGCKTLDGRLTYPQMKIIDMAFWKYGFQLENDGLKEKVTE